MRYKTSKYTHCIGKFFPNSNVIISLIDLDTLLPVSLVSNECIPIPSHPSYYIWNALENIETSSLSVLEKEYIYVMTDGTNDFPGKIVVGGYGDLKAKLNEWVETIYTVETGRWKLNRETHQMIFYGEDDVTPLLTFDLKDDKGNPNAECVFERVKSS